MACWRKVGGGGGEVKDKGPYPSLQSAVPSEFAFWAIFDVFGPTQGYTTERW